METEKGPAAGGVPARGSGGWPVAAGMIKPLGPRVCALGLSGAASAWLWCRTFPKTLFLQLLQVSILGLYLQSLTAGLRFLCWRGGSLPLGQDEINTSGIKTISVRSHSVIID